MFSSSATVYSDPERLPLAEDALLTYGRSKLMVEDVLRNFNPFDAYLGIERMCTDIWRWQPSNRDCCLVLD